MMKKDIAMADVSQESSNIQDVNGAVGNCKESPMIVETVARWRIVTFFQSITVEPVLFLYMTAAFLSFPTFQYLLYDKICYEAYGAQANYSAVCSNLDATNATTERDYVQGRTSLWILYATLCYTFPSCLTAAFVGSWSDHYGKKVVMLLPFIGGFCEKFVGMFSALYLEMVPLWAFLPAALAAGCTGNFAVAIQTAFSYIADITTMERRSSRVAVLESMTFVGALVGAALISVLLGRVPTYVVYVVILALYVTGCVYVVVRIRNVVPPQTHIDNPQAHIDTSEAQVDTPQARATTCQSRTNPGHRRQSRATFLFNVEHVWQSYRTLLMYREGGRRTDIWLIILSMCLYVIAASGERDVSYLYLINAPLSWSPAQYGYYQFYYYSLLSLALMLGLPLIRWSLGTHDLTIAILGAVSKMAGYLVLSFATQTWIVYTAVTVGGLSLMSAASLRSVLSKIGSPDEQGKLFAVLASLESLSSVVATSVFNPLYKASLPVWTGLSFALCAATVGVMLAVIGYLRYRMRNFGSEYKFRTLVEDAAEEC